MRFMCYTEQDGESIRIELTGNTLPPKKWQFVRDSAKDVLSSAYWAKTLRFPKGRVIIIALKEPPNKKSWKAITERWLNVLETREIVPERFADNAVLFKKDDGKLEMVREELPSVVISKLQKAFWEECADMVEAAKDVEKLREKYERGKETLRKERENLRQLAEYLDDQDVDCDENAECESWVEAAIEKGALEE